jgi:hypothetical protein
MYFGGFRANPDNLAGEPPQKAAQPPLAVAKYKFEPPFYFSLLIIVYL